jgi:hypothetical protein
VYTHSWPVWSQQVNMCGYVWVGHCTHVYMHHRNPQIHLLWSREVLNLDLHIHM